MTAYREDGRDALNEVDSLAERVKKLEEKPVKEPSKPWTNRQLMILNQFCAAFFAMLGGLAPSLFSSAVPFAIGTGAASAICVVATIALARSGDK